MNRGISVGVGIVCGWACAAGWGQGLIVHAMTGQPVGGGLPGEVYTSMSMSAPPRIDGGNIVFRTRTSASELESVSPLMVGQIGRSAVGFRFEGETGIPGVEFAPVSVADTSGTTRASASGAFGLVVRLQGLGVSDSNNEALVVGTPDGLRIVAREGSQAPGDSAGAVIRAMGTGNTWHADVSGWALSSTGRVALTTPVSRAGQPSFASHSGAYSDVSGELALVARGNHGTWGQGTPVEGWAVHMLDGAARITPGGTVAAAALFDSPSPQSGGVVVKAAGGPERLASLQEVPGLPGVRINREWQNGIAVGLNGRGDVATGTRLLNQSAQPIGSAVVVASRESIQIVAKTGDPKPGRPGETFSLGELERTSVRLSGSGTVAFVEQSNQGVFVGTSIADLRLAFDPASNVWPAVLGTPSVSPGTLGMNVSDQLVAALTFQGSGATAIAGWDPVGGSVLLAYTGQTIEIEPGIFRTIAELSINGHAADVGHRPWSSGGGEDGAPNAIDSAGRVVFTARFTNNEYAVLVATVPSPGAAALWFLALATVRRRR